MTKPAASRVRSAEVEPSQALRERILDTASALFYTQGVRAVGVDLVVQESKVAKTSMYRYFPTKDDLIVAYLEREDEQFWAHWDEVASRHASEPMGELEAHVKWIAQRLARSNYRGCPQINVAAEFADADHPARKVSRRHMKLLRERLLRVTQRLQVARPDELAAQIAVLLNGAFVSAELLKPSEASSVLLDSVGALVRSARRDRQAAR